jgi:hypothetical protein
MKSFIQKYLSSIETRFRRSRPGSVLIIVIVLLLLLAILGAAYISTTRSSRVASAQNVLSSDVDSSLNGIAEVCQGVITDDLNDSFGNLHGINPGATQNVNSAYQGQYVIGQTYSLGDIVSIAPSAGPPVTPAAFYVAVVNNPATGPVLGAVTPWMQTTHVPITSSQVQPWLAERIPTPDGVPSPAPPIPAYWPNISQSFVPAGSNAPTSIIGTPFESPDGTPMPALSPGYMLTGKSGTNLVPDFETLSSGITVPVLDYPNGAGTAHLIAGDADGDGIADSLLFRVPGMSIDGLTWYAGVRIIDNNSAINANTAWSRDQEFGWPGGVWGTLGANSNYYSLFPGSVGLLELLNPNDAPGTNFNNFNIYRYGGGTLTSPVQQPSADATPSTGTPPANPTAPVPRTDFQFLTGGDILNSQLGSRIANPGFDGNSGLRFQAIPQSDQAALAYHFCLVNPEATTSGVPSSLIENLLPFSLFYYPPAPGTTKNYRSIPYGGNGTIDVTTWFNDNFNYDTPTADYSTTSGAGPQPIRPLIVSRNPVSNYITPVYDFNLTNIGEPLEPLGVLSNPYVISAGTVPGMMLPYGTFGTGITSYAHFRGNWTLSPTPAYQFNDTVVGGDGFTYINVSTTGGNTLTPPTIASVFSTNATPWQLQPWTKSAVKANVNTATFRELYRAFWSVMSGNPSNQSPFGANTNINTNPTSFDPYWPDPNAGTITTDPQHQFRSPLRDPTYTTASAVTNITRMDPENTMLLRAAIASVNTLGLRDNSQNVISRTVYLNAMVNTPPGPAVQTPVMARVYSNAPQPVISEVYANTYTGSDNGNHTINPQGYVAIELYNPYPTILVLNNWQVGLVNRIAGAPYPKLVFQTTAAGASVIGPMQVLNDPTLPGNASPLPASYPIKIPPHGYAILENYNGSVGSPLTTFDATCRSFGACFAPTGGPPVEPGSFYSTLAGGGQQNQIWYGTNGPGSVAIPANTCDVYVPNLQLVISGTTGASITGTSTGGELVLLRPRRSDGAYSASSDPLNTFGEGSLAAPVLNDLVPVDSYDFTGLAIDLTAATGNEWSYVRQKGINAATWFKQIYPGRYTTLNSPASSRQIGTVTMPITTAVQNPPWAPALPDATPKFGEDATIASYINNFPPIQLYNVGLTVNSHWPNATLAPAIGTGVTADAGVPLQAPFGTFARNGDMLDIPFVGAYRITVASEGNTPTDFVELNSLPMDCSFADATYNDGDTTDQNAENIGRFLPIQARLAPTAGWVQPDYYAWCRKLFSYLTVQSPSDAHMPNFDPNISDVTTPAALNNGKYQKATVAPNQIPSIVLSADATASDQTSQGNVGVEGLININTASWKVLSMLPMVTKNEDPTGSNYLKDNESLAKAIVAWRITHGPFTSIYDLNAVVDSTPANAGTTVLAGTPIGFQNAEGWLNPAKGGQAGGGISSLNGSLSPPDPAFPGVSAGPPVGIASGLTEDYQSDFAVLTRISNLITTRSDTFTVYVVLQGWQNVGSTTPGISPQPMVTRRFAYIVDRSQINSDPSTRFLKTLTVPND